MLKPLPSYDYLHECFTYKDGCLFWKQRPLHHYKSRHRHAQATSRCATKQADHNSGHGYRIVWLDTQLFFAHRVIWKMFTGEDPANLIDHINRNPMDNRIENLRIATHSQNHANEKLSKNNKSGYKGVSISTSAVRGNCRKIWQARLQHKRRVYSLGLFATPEEAAAAYRAAAKKMFDEFAA